MEQSTYIRKKPDLIPSTLIARASKLSSALLSDGLEGLGFIRNGCMDASIMPVDSSMIVIGTAYTVGTEEGDNFPIHVSIYQNEPGYVLVIDGKKYEERAYMGDLMVSAAKAVGINGIVIDGYVRDYEGLKEIALPVFSRGFMQRSPMKKGPGEINSVIHCAGVVVKPGDLIFGDCDGVTVVPRDLIEVVLDRAEKKYAYELERRKTIEQYEQCRLESKPLPEIAPSWVLEMMNKVQK